MNEMTMAAEATRPFWTELRLKRAQRVPRAELGRAIDLAGERFCRAALRDERPFARGCEDEARGTRGELRRALVCLAAAGGRKVAHELARRRAAELRAHAQELEPAGEDELLALVERLGRDAVERRLAGRVGFRSACLYEGALRGLDNPQIEAAWVRLACAEPVRVRRALAPNGPERAERAEEARADVPARRPAEMASRVRTPTSRGRHPQPGPVPLSGTRRSRSNGAVLVRSFGEGGESPLATALREALAEAG